MSAVGAFGSTASFGSLGVPGSTSRDSILREVTSSGTGSNDGRGTPEAREAAVSLPRPTGTSETPPLLPLRVPGTKPEANAEEKIAVTGASGNVPSSAANAVAVAGGASQAALPQSKVPQSTDTIERSALDQSGDQDSRAPREILPIKLLRSPLPEPEVLGSEALPRAESFDPAEFRKELSTRLADLVDQFEELLQRIDDQIEANLPTPERPVATLPGENAPSLDELVTAADLVLEGLLSNAGQLIGPVGAAGTQSPDAQGRQSGAFNDPELNILL